MSLLLFPISLDENMRLRVCGVAAFDSLLLYEALFELDRFSASLSRESSNFNRV
jgi:hypothetical protein